MSLLVPSPSSPVLGLRIQRKGQWYPCCCLRPTKPRLDGHCQGHRTGTGVTPKPPGRPCLWNRICPADLAKHWQEERRAVGEEIPQWLPRS